MAADRRIEPREIAQEGAAALRITWSDGRICRYRAADLRRLCPCAQCVNEWTGERILCADTISDDLTIQDLELIGRYALCFRWSDGHQTGIYSFKYLRELCERAERKRDDDRGHG
ncbi:MAG: hypothetical protein C4336_09985 [Armatimonadota bacterium]|uniref:DUF971 domain-containing protein n=1 Tax=Pyrinomonas sp. TaxID=2080306 RepID=UPI0033346CAB